LYACNSKYQMNNLIFRYDYEGCESDPCAKMMAELEAKVTDPSFVGAQLTAPTSGKIYTVAKGDNFEYTDPIDKSVTKGQVKP
jgi:phosphoglucomutase